MKVGMLFTSLSFVIAGVLQLLLENATQLSVAWQVLVSIAGLEFAYSQAPQSMKSVITAIWLLTVAFGNAFVALVAEVSPVKLSIELFFYAVLMFFFLIVFIVITRKYQYIDIKKDTEENESNSNNRSGNSNDDDDTRTIASEGKVYQTFTTREDDEDKISLLSNSK
ncbi:hypothetical protein HMI54_009432 [Coelomomyces lativittatus]|nr:hypothetical protein HMI54_009432 [Coelomomyces lativittatus]